MDENKSGNRPNNFKEAATSGIPKDVLERFMESVPPMLGGSPMDEIARQLGKGPLPVSKPIPQQEKFLTLAIDNVALKVSVDPYQGAMTLFCYLLAMVWSKDKRIAKILKSFNFSFSDANGAILYPKQKRGKKK